MHTLVTSLAGAQRYVVERELGHGGMGVVYQVLDLERNSRVALKALNKIDAINIYRLKNEFRQLADLSHPNLVSLHELHCENDLWFFTMELVVGETFDVYVSTNSATARIPDRAVQTTLAGRARIVRDASVTLSQHGIGSEFPLDRANCDLTRLRAALRQLIAAVGAIHEAGKLHRDIKPSNVLVTESGRLVVLDFGLVSNSTLVESHEAAAEHTIGGAVFGTPAYMSPEQAVGEPVSTASDWYSVGCMLYEALTGQLPFEGTVLEILKRKEESEPPAPSDLVRGVPEDLNDLCCKLLRRRPEERPTSADMQRMFLTSSLPPAPAPNTTRTSSQSPGELFIGREPHLAALRRAFESVKRGRPATVFVHGHSGMGKSALVRCFANELIKNQEAVVLRGRCYERESLPYKAFDDIVDALSRHMMRLPTEEASELLPRNIHALAHLFPVLRRVRAVAHARTPLHPTTDPHEIRQQAFGALKDLLARLSDWQPLVVTIDDLQWGDMDSARLLAHLLGPPDPPPILFIAVYRREEADTSPLLRSVLLAAPLEGGVANIQPLPVDALATDEAAHLARELLRDMPYADADFARSLSYESEGVPFFIGELVQHVKEHADALATPLHSLSLDGVIASRVNELNATSRRLLEVLSVAGRPLEQGVALEAANIPVGDREALLALRAARLIRTRGTRQTDHAETYHDRVREAVTASLSEERVREIHSRVARASEVWGVGEPEQLVVHYAEAGEGGRAGETALQAARSASNKLAFNRASELFRKAIELLEPEEGVRRRELFEELGNALANAGRGAPAAEAFLEAARASNPWDASMLRRKAAQQYLRSGRVEEGLRLLEQLLAEVGVGGFHSNARLVTSLLWNKSILRFAAFAVAPANDPMVTPRQAQRLDTLAAFREVSAIDVVRGSYLHSEFLRTAIKTAEPTRLLEGFAWEAVHLAHGQGVKAQSRVERLLRRSEELANQLNTPAALATLNLARAASYVALARFREAYPIAREAERLLREHCPGTFWERSLAMSLRYACVELVGSLRELAEEAFDRAREANEREDAFSRAFLGVHAHMAQLMHGDPEGALRSLDDERAQLGKDFTTFHLWVMSRTVDAYNYCGEGARAWEHLASQWPLFEQTLFFRAQLYHTNAQYLSGRTAVAAYLETGVAERLRDARAAVTALHRLQRPDAEMYAHLIAAGIARCEDLNGRAAEQLAAALFVARAQGFEMFTLYVQYCMAAVDTAEPTQAAAQAAEAELRAQGVGDLQRWVGVYVPGFR